MAMRTGSGGLGFLDRLKTGWTLTKDSVGVIRDHPKLLAFPLLAGVSSIVFLVLFFVPLVLSDAIGGGLEYVVLFALYFGTTFLSTYFSAALVHAANEAFHGREPRLRDSTHAVSGSLGPILVWSIISATVSVVFRLLENSDNPVAAVLRSLFAIGWAILTFFIVPVIVFEDVTATSMFERSGETFRDTWGETLGAGFGITAIVIGIGLVLVVGAIAVSVPVGAVLPGAGIILAVVLVAVALVLTFLLSQTIWGIAKTALYLYAVEGATPSSSRTSTSRRSGAGPNSARRPDRGRTAGRASDPAGDPTAAAPPATDDNL